MARFQCEKGENSSLVVQNINGVSVGQCVNNLGILTNGQENSSAAQVGFTAQAAGMVTGAAAAGSSGQVDLVTEQTTRNSEIVSHADSILDLALVDFRQDNQSAPLLISCSRDSTVKVWRC